MGLDTTYNCWHGPYSAFCRWRHKLAEVAGYAIWKVKYDDDIIRDTIMIDWGHIVAKNYMGQWDKIPDDPLIILIAHSDCEGGLPLKTLEPLKKRLEELLPLLPDDSGMDYWKKDTQQFIDGLADAISENKGVSFH